MKDHEDSVPEHESESEQPGWLPPLWSPDGHNFIPTSGKAWLVVIILAVAFGVLISWL